MNLSELQSFLGTAEQILILQTNGEAVPSHFHVTEVGLVTKRFIDCGGTLRDESVVSLQLWEADDYDHRLHPEKMLHILNLSQKKLGIPDLPVEVEYQGKTIGKYALELGALSQTGQASIGAEGITVSRALQLVSKRTDCLAKSDCGIPKAKVDLSNLVASDANCCTPGGGCC